jgi:predicted nucleic-acid-binding Zn-ribbon protein
MEVDYLKAINWIRQNWTKPSECPICGSDNWGIGDQIVEMRPSSPGSPVYPQFFVYCRKCSYTIFFNAVVAGLIDLKSSTKPKA